MKSIHQKFGAWGRSSQWRMALCIGGATSLVSLGNAGAAIVYSGQKNIGITSGFDGVFINVTALQSTTSGDGSWDLNPFFGGLGIANSPGFQPVRSGTGNEDPILALALGASVSSSVNYSSDWGGSGAEDDSGHIGPGAGQFTAGQTGYLGFKLLRGTDVNYGWMRVNLTRNGDTGAILDWAYDDSGSSILTGAVSDLGAAPIVRNAGTEQTLSASQAGTGLLMEEGAKITFNDGTLGGSYAGKIQGAGEIQVAGAGGLRLAGTNTFSGTASVLEGSRLTVGEAGNLGSAQIKIGSSGSLEFDSLAANNGSANTFGNAITLDGQTATLNNSGSGKVVLSGSIDSNGGLLGFTGGSFDVLGGITGTGSLRKEGSGTLTLSGVNTYTGNTIVSGGALAINGSVSGDSNVIVETGGTLKGSGSIGGSLDISGSLAVGNSPGVLTSSGTTNFNSGSIFEWEIDTSQSNPETNRGIAYDGLNTSALTGSDAMIKIILTGAQDFADLFWKENRVWTDIFKTADGSTSISDWASVFSGGFQYSYNGQTIAPTTYGSFTVTGSSLNWSAVPEPDNALLGLLAASALLRRRRVKAAHLKSPFPPRPSGDGTPPINQPDRVWK